MIERDNGNVHRAAANIIVSKNRAARGSVCNVLLFRDSLRFKPLDVIDAFNNDGVSKNLL
jgi:hypothetical protein